ncbi:MAG: hypothetical protein BMS9Abin02_0203 [Anaerolineae bacterium]|nr:MAG: hypothetical protein BMS9Abin02_0203 [Anaerolineae bacterium]
MMKLTVNQESLYLIFSASNVYDICARLFLPDFYTDLYFECRSEILDRFTETLPLYSDQPSIFPGEKIYDEQAFQIRLKVKPDSCPYAVSGQR